MERQAVDGPSQIAEAIRILKEGGIVALPTDTVYGLAADMTNPAAVARVYSVKRRPEEMALPLLVADEDGISRLAATLPQAARQLIAAFLPGQLTIVVQAADTVPDSITAGGGTVAVRIPNHPLPIALINGIGGPITGTSANLSSLATPLTAAEVRSQLGDGVDLVIDSGEPCPGTASTIIDVTAAKPVLLREGAVSMERLRQVVCEIEAGEGD